MDQVQGKVSAPIESMKGIELERSFLMTLGEWRDQLEYLDKSDITTWSDEEVEMFVRNLFVIDSNIQEMISIIESGEHRHAS